MAIIPNGTKVRHKERKNVYAIVTGTFTDGFERYYYVEVYNKNGVLQAKNGNWMASNCILMNYKNNAEAKKLLEGDY